MSLQRKYKMKPSFELSDLENAYIEGFNHALKLADAYIADKRPKRKHKTATGAVPSGKLITSLTGKRGPV